MRELMSEVMLSMRSNKMRIALTGFSIAWGMFILVVLLGAAGGFQRGIARTFHFDSPQVVQLSTGLTSQPYGGYQTGRSITLNMADTALLANIDPEVVKHIYPSVVEQLRINNGTRYAQISMTGCTPGFVGVTYNKIDRGRDINQLDINSQSKVCVLSQRLGKELFGEANPIGQKVTVGDVAFLVVGITKSILTDDNSLGAYAPISTMLSLYRPKGNIDAFRLQVAKMKTAEENVALVSKLRTVLAYSKGCSPNDFRAIQVDNPFENTIQVQNVLTTIGAFVWVIGIATLLAGIVGVSNIMLITVKERTRELGVRKAMGASNGSIIRLVLLESVIITMLFGYVGLMGGIGLTQLLDSALGSVFPMFQNPTVQFLPVIICNLVMILAGLVAGYVPAKRATTIKLVEALTS